MGEGEADGAGQVQAPVAQEAFRRPSLSHFKTIVRNASASTLGASVVALLVTPLDVVKVRMQAHVCPVAGTLPCEDARHVGGTADAVRKIIRTDGPRGLWRGLSVTLVLAVPTTGLYFTMYEAIRSRATQRYPDMSPSLSALCSGATARVITATAASPLELARTSLQSGIGGENATVMSVLRHLYRKEGFFSLWRGLGPTLMRDAPFSAIYWTAYDALKDAKRSILPQSMFAPGREFSVFLTAGIGAGGLAALCTIPADVIKTRRQAWEGAKASGMAFRHPTSVRAIAANIVTNEGFRGLFRGAGPRVAKVGPSCAIMMGSYELFRRWFGG